MSVFRAVKGKPPKGMFWVTANTDWARSGCYSTPQDSIKELLNCVLDGFDISSGFALGC